eukprot:10865120-Alexandrium_andersonii.AAC.1
MTLQPRPHAAVAPRLARFAGPALAPMPAMTSTVTTALAPATRTAVGRALGTLLKDLTEVKADFEQRLPQLNYVGNEGKTVEAIMDVAHGHPQLGRLWVDVAC